MAELTLTALTKVYPNGVHAVRDLDLQMSDTELLVLVGPSGCGKTSVLRMVAGLEEVSSGTITLDGRVINDLDEASRDIAMVFQSYALYPHMSVRGNIAFPLKLAKVPRSEREDRVQQAASVLGLERYLDAKPGSLSGGQRQRVAMGRAIVRRPRAFLMDEPLSNLDAKLRVQTRAEILDIQKRLGITTMYVTHDQSEAMTLGDRVALLRDGVLQQVAPPEIVYSCPTNVFTAGFIGDPSMNLGFGRVTSDGTDLAIAFGDNRVTLDTREESKYPLLRAHIDDDVIVGMRPESLVDAGDGRRERRIRGRVTVRESLGSDVLAHFAVRAECELPAHVRGLVEGVDPSDDSLLPAGSVIFTARLPADAAVRRFDDLTLTVEPGGLHFFDARSGDALRDGGGIGGASRAVAAETGDRA